MILCRYLTRSATSQWGTEQYSIALHSLALHGTALHCIAHTALHGSAIQPCYGIAPSTAHSIALHSMTPYTLCIVQYDTIHFMCSMPHRPLHVRVLHGLLWHHMVWHGTALHLFSLHSVALQHGIASRYGIAALHHDMALHSTHCITQPCICDCTALHMALHSNRHCPPIPGIIALHIRASLHYIPFSPLHCTPLHNHYASIAGHFGHSSMSLLGYLLALHIVNTTLYGKGSS